MDELISDFLTETTEGLEILDNDLVNLEQNPNDEKLLGNIFRVMHTIKGTCGFLGLSRLESVAHSGENILGKIRDKELEVTPDIISAVLESVDQIKFIVQHITDHESEPEGDDKELIARLDALAEGAGAPPPVMEGSIDAAPDEAPEEQAIIEEDTTPTTEIPSISEEDKPAPTPVPAKASPPPAEEKSEAPQKTTTAAPQSLRVGIDVLEYLMQEVSELVLTRNQLMQLSRSQNDSTFTTPLQRLNVITSQLQDGVMKTRMQPISNAWTKFPRIIRDLANDLDKKIELHMEGEETELDRQLLEFIKDPLTHMVRNSCDHGLEPPADRIAAGKPETGNVYLRAYHQSGHIIIEIADDGRGIDPKRIAAKAVEKGLASEHDIANMSDKQICQFIFHPGFSTAEKITSVSGRGVGMDVVKNNIEKISGHIELNSKLGKGSTFFIKIPLTLAIMPVLIIKSADQRFAIPQINVLEMVKIGKEYTTETINNTPVLRLRNHLLPLISIAEGLQLRTEDTLEGKFVVVCKVGENQVGFIVDKVFDTEEIVVKPLSNALKHLDMYSGSTILGDGSVIMILELNGLLKTLSIDTAHQQTQLNEKHHLIVEDKTSFQLLQFKSGTQAPKVVPLELVTRLEEIDVSKIERSGSHDIIQYRGDLMRLINLDPSYKLPESGVQEVIVFTDGKKIMGMIIEEIMDIVDHAMSTQFSNGSNGFLGSVVINNVTCDMLDVSYYFSQLFSDWSDELKKSSNAQHILLVDDSPFFRKFIPPTLETVGYQVTVAENGKEALKILAKDTSFAAIITDINMPEMGGEEFIQHCKENENLAHIPIIALSSNNSEDFLASATEALLENLAGYVSKTNHSGLLELVEKHSKNLVA